MLPIIGIAGNQLLRATDTFQGNQVTYTPQGFVNAVQQANGLPIVLPITKPDMAFAYVDKIDKLILAGGQDVSPQLYNEAPHPKLLETNLQRDLFEEALIKEAIKQNKAIFAVCRGMQLLNVILGGSLYQDLSTYSDWSVKHVQQPTSSQFATHEVTVLPNTILSTLLPSSYFVNSYHHQALKELAAPLKASALSPDGLVEGIESKDAKMKLLGVQWHPELTHFTNEFDQKLFTFLYNNFNVFVKKTVFPSKNDDSFEIHSKNYRHFFTFISHNRY